MQDMMDAMDIAFPHLGIYLRNVPKQISIGNFTIALYGIIIAIGMLCGIALAAHMAKKTGQKSDTYWDISIWLIIFAIIGARVYYVIFFWDAYKDNLIQIFNLRGGGLAIYGGVIGGVITAIVYCHHHKLRPLVILDTASYGLILGQIIGRWANFFNREVFGGYTDSLLAMRLPIEMVRQRDITPDLASHIVAGTNYIQVHPTFLYESLWNLMILIIMLAYTKHKKFDGEILLLYFGGYGLGRAWIEYIRTDQLYFAGTTIPVSMVLAIVMLVASVILDIYGRNRVRKLKAAGKEMIPLWTQSTVSAAEDGGEDGSAGSTGEKEEDPDDPYAYDTIDDAIAAENRRKEREAAKEKKAAEEKETVKPDPAAAEEQTAKPDTAAQDEEAAKPEPAAEEKESTEPAPAAAEEAETTKPDAAAEEKSSPEEAPGAENT